MFFFLFLQTWRAGWKVCYELDVGSQHTLKAITFDLIETDFLWNEWIQCTHLLLDKPACADVMQTSQDQHIQNFSQLLSLIICFQYFLNSQHDQWSTESPKQNWAWSAINLSETTQVSTYINVTFYTSLNIYPLSICTANTLLQASIMPVCY